MKPRSFWQTQFGSRVRQGGVRLTVFQPENDVWPASNPHFKENEIHWSTLILARLL